MSIQLNRVVPWGRSMDEYQRMFKLTAEDLQKKIVGCADGPASFNAEMTALGKNVVSFDPIYSFQGSEIADRFQESLPEVLQQVAKNSHNYVWKYHPDIPTLQERRTRALKLFLSDFESGGKCRYLADEFPVTKFSTGQFELALCSHFLFLYSDHFNFEFHLTSIIEMCRIAGEARIFPLLSLDCKRSHHLDTCIDNLRQLGFVAEIEEVSYELQRGANQMLKVQRA